MPATKSGRKKPDATLIDAILEHQASKKRKRRTPARVLARRLINKKTRGTTLLALAVVVVAGVALLGRYATIGAGALVAAIGIGLVAFLLLCEAWPEMARWGWLNRRMLIPFAALALMAVPEVTALLWPRPTLMAALAGLLFTAYSHANLLMRHKAHSHAAGYIPRQWLPMAYLATGWTALACRAGLGRATLAVLLIGWLAWAGRFWFVNRTRGSHQIPMEKRWNETIANPDKEYTDIPTSDRLVGSRLVNVRTVPGGMAATVVLPPGQKGSKVDASTEVIASVYGVNVTDVTVDQSASGGANKRDLFVLPRSPLHKPTAWRGSDLDLERYVSTVGTYIDGARVEYVWREWHDLISGTTGSGKSRLLDLLLATSRSSKGLIVDWVLDPQNGQSLPDWQDEVDWFAAGVEDGMRMLRAARSVMYARNRVLARQEWTDSRGKTRRGVKQFTPTVEMPLLVLTIEEAHAVLTQDEAKAICEDIAKMGRKCGLKLRLVTQVPTLSQLGNSNVLRSMVASGNVIVLRTGNRSDSQFAFQGALQVDPVSIPRRMPDGSSSAGLGFALGAESRQAPMRTDYVEDPLDHVTGPVWRLSGADAASAGRDYARRGIDPDVIEGEVIADTADEPQAAAEEAPAEGVVLRGPGGITCADRAIQIVKAYADRAVYPDASVSKGQVINKLVKPVGAWEWQMVTKTLKAIVHDPSKPVWSSSADQLYYKEEAS